MKARHNYRDLKHIQQTDTLCHNMMRNNIVLKGMAPTLVLQNIQFTNARVTDQDVKTFLRDLIFRRSLVLVLFQWVLQVRHF